MGSIFTSFGDQEDDDWFDNEIRDHHSWRAFEHPDNIADAIRLVSNISLWEEAANKIGVTSTDIKDQLKLIVDRRNKIAHEADVNPTLPDTRWPIDAKQVNDAVDFIENVGETVNALLYPQPVANTPP
jgi:hypothetical protein